MFYEDNSDKVELLISFCIAAYKRTDITLELVRELLSVEDNRFEVVICEDKSDDGGLEEYKKIKDARLKIYENHKNLGGYLNICETLDKGEGQYLFYVNDRDNVDVFKVKKLLSLIPTLLRENVTFARCDSGFPPDADLHIFAEGEKAILEFGCRITHPTGYIFERNEWRNTERRRFFESQEYGIYAFSIVCALQGRRHKGAILHGDICDVKRARIDFKKEKSGFYKNRKNKYIWYTPEAIYIELKVILHFMREYNFDDTIVEKCFIKRYKEYLQMVTVGYKEKLMQEANTIHYGLRPPESNLEVAVRCIRNKIILKNNIKKLIKNSSESVLLIEIERVEHENKAEIMDYIIKELLDWIIGNNYKWNL